MGFKQWLKGRSKSQDKPKIYEDNFYQQSTKLINPNTDEQIKRGQFYLARYNELKAEMESRMVEWEKLNKHYKCEREEVEGVPNSFIPITTPIVNGQIASMTDSEIKAVLKGRGPGDNMQASNGQNITDFVFQQNNIRQVLKVALQQYVLFGNCVMCVDWDDNALDGFGMPVLRAPQITKVFVDGNIKNMIDFQKADFVIEEIGYQSILWARQQYGDDVASYLRARNSSPDFDSEISQGEQFSFMLIRVWHRSNDERKLECLEMDSSGFILRESEPGESYYKYVGDLYPYSFAGMDIEQGNFYRFGDGKKLFFIQETINKLFDEIITACKFNSQPRTFIDPAAEMDPDDFDNDPSHPIGCTDPRNNVYVAPPGQISTIIERMVAFLLSEGQRVTRFSALMAGNDTGEKITATQAGIQAQQGNTNIQDKKSDISDMLRHVVYYILGLCMEKWEKGQWMRITGKEGKDEYLWLDTRQLRSVPMMIEPDSAYESQWKKQFPNEPLPTHIQLEPDEDIMDEEGNMIAKAGEAQTRPAIFDITVSIGEGLPNNPMALYNIILSLAQLQIPDEVTGQPKPIMGYSQVRRMIEDVVGLPLDDAMEKAKELSSLNNPMQTPSMGGTVNPVNINPNIPGANMNGTSMTGGAF